MNYSLHQLLIYLKVVELKSITKASEQMFLTQPAVSIQLKSFQDQFKEPLLEQIGKKIYITDFGIEVAYHAKIILEQINEIKNKASTFEGLLYGTLKIAVVSTGNYIMPYFLTDFLNNNKDVKLEMDVTNKETVIESLKKNKIDFALVSIIPDSLQVESIELMSNIMFMIGNNSLEINIDKDFQEIIDTFPLIYREIGSGTRQTMEKFIKNNKIKVQKNIELTSNEAVKQAILANLGVSLMPIIGLKNELLNQNLKIINCKSLPINTNWQLIWLKEKKLNYLNKNFVNYLKNSKEKIIQKHFFWYKEFLKNQSIS